jgi:hypothetical protein
MRALLAAILLLSPTASADDFLTEEAQSPEDTRHLWAWPERAHFDTTAGLVTLNWPPRTGAPIEKIPLDDVIRFERARPFEERPDELFALVADGRRVLVARGPDVSAQASITAAMTDLPVKELAPGDGHFDANAAGTAPQVVVGGGGGVAIQPVDKTEIAGGSRASSAATAPADEVEDPNLEGEGGGTLEKYAIDIVIKQKMGRIRECYTRELRRDPNLTGRVVVRFVIGRSGAVTYASIRASDLGNSIVEDCVVGEVQAATFPTPRGDGSVIVSYPFTFSGG